MTKTKKTKQIVRFKKTERIIHWSLAIPFLICFISAAILVFVYNPEPDKEYRIIFSWLHRLGGLGFIVFPLIAIFKSRGDMRIHFYNIRQAWVWVFDDIKWIMLKGLAAMSSRYKLPEQGKFNAAEKLNFMILMVTYPFYVVTGVAMWVTDAAVISWIVHILMALNATPLILGHIYMACVNADTKAGLSGMITGKVDSEWAKHHYGNWYRELYGTDSDDSALDLEKIEKIGTEAINAHRVLLQANRLEESPLKYALTQQSLGKIHIKLASYYPDSNEHYFNGIKAFEEALKVYQSSIYPDEHTQVARELLSAQKILSTLHKEENVKTQDSKQENREVPSTTYLNPASVVIPES